MHDILEFKEEYLFGERKLSQGYVLSDFGGGSRKRDKIGLDWETACDLDLTKVGLDRYSAHPSCRVLMCAYRINDRQMQHWEPHKRRIPTELVEALEDPEVEKWAFNAQFERVIAARQLQIRTPIKLWRCAMVLAYMQSFMGRLEDVGEQIGLPTELMKSKRGKDLIRMFCMPQKLRKNNPHEWRNWLTDPEAWEEFVDYNKQDVIAEEAVIKRLISFPVLEDEWDFYELDQLINDRGMPVDWDFVINVIEMSDRRRAELLYEMRQLTGLWNPNSVSQLLPWLQNHGYPYDDLQAPTIQKAINQREELFYGGEMLEEETEETMPPVVQVLYKRQWASVRAIDKAHAARRYVGEGMRARYLYKFAAASRTNRFASQGIQSQNMKRTPPLLDPENGPERLEITTELIRNGDYDGFDLFIREPMLAFTGAMRGMFRAPDGEWLVTADFKSVESAGLGWAARCPRLLKVFADGRDPYRDFGMLFYQKGYDEISKFERQICKPPALACGYGMGAGVVKDGVKTGLLAYAEKMNIEMTQEQSVRAVQVYRSGYPEVPEFWKACEVAVKSVLGDGKPYDLGPFRFEWIKPYMTIRLPSGRRIYYYKPKLEWRTIDTGRVKQVKSRGMSVDGYPIGELIWIPETFKRLVLSYMGRNQKTTQWTRVYVQWALIVENIVQAFTRDILKVGLMRLHEDGWPLIGHSHDEAIAQVRKGDNYFTHERMCGIMAQPIDWLPGFPLGASGWSAPFYRK